MSSFGKSTGLAIRVEFFKKYHGAPQELLIELANVVSIIKAKVLLNIRTFANISDR